MPLNRFTWLAADELEGCLANEHRGYYIWIGGQRLDVTDKDSAFVWKPHNGTLSYIKWDLDSGEPNNWGGIESCLNVWPERIFEWNDQSCDTKMFFVCQMEF